MWAQTMLLMSHPVTGATMLLMSHPVTGAPMLLMSHPVRSFSQSPRLLCLNRSFLLSPRFYFSVL